MITIFALPKPFRGFIETLQRNAIQSWTLFKPKPEIILFGDEAGTKEIAQELGLRHMPEIARSEFGTPLVNQLFDKAQQIAGHKLVCYINADIILMSDFMEAVHQVASLPTPFLMIGRRWYLDFRERLAFEPGWEEKLRAYVLKHGKLNPPIGIDYHLFPAGFIQDMPPFAIGRMFWDQWLLYKARARKGLLIDATPSVMAIHPIHDYSHLERDVQPILSREAVFNQRFSDASSRLAKYFSTRESTHKLVNHSVKRDFLGTAYFYLAKDLLVYRWSLRVHRPIVKLSRYLKNRIFSLLRGRKRGSSGSFEN